MAETTSFGFETVKVNTEELKVKAEDAWQKIRQYQMLLETISQAVNVSSSYWLGAAGNAYRSVLQIQLKEILTALETYAVYPKELLSYAGVYSETIAKTEGLAEEVQSLKLF